MGARRSLPPVRRLSPGEGPAPRPLERWKVSVGDDGQLVVDRSRKFQNERGEWSNPESFITV